MKKIQMYLLSVASGFILSRGWPMHGFPFLLFAGFVPLLFVEDYIDRSREKFYKFSLFTYAYLAFFIWNVLTTWWIWNSTIFGAIMAIILNSLFMALVFTFFHWSKRSFLNSKYAIYLFVLYWISFEFLHLDWDLSWPWLNLGNGFGMYTKWVQWYEFTGALGGSLWILIMNVLFFKLVQSLLQNMKSWRKISINFLSVALFIIVPMWISDWLYRNYDEVPNPVEVVVTQPNIDPWSEQYVLAAREVINRTLKLADSLVTAQTEFVVCPESAIQEDIWHHIINKSPSILQIRKLMKVFPNLNLIIGASTFRLFQDGEPITQTARKFSDVDKYYDAYNSALFINSKEDIGLYHKSKLVPGPEKMPFQGLLRPFQEFAFDLGGTVGSLGLSDEREVFTSIDGKFKVPAIICYESIYGEFCSKFVKNGANLLFIVTNDGWWGNTAGHRQHFAFAPLLSVETRRSLARSANTGISGFINQRGDIVEQTEYWVPAVIKTNLNSNDKITFYVKYGDYIGRIMSFLSGLFILISITSSITNRKKLRLKRSPKA
jgi:apolipoprotein N-acyltransferase